MPGGEGASTHRLSHSVPRTPIRPVGVRRHPVQQLRTPLLPHRALIALPHRRINLIPMTGAYHRRIPQTVRGSRRRYGPARLQLVDGRMAHPIRTRRHVRGKVTPHRINHHRRIHHRTLKCRYHTLSGIADRRIQIRIRQPQFVRLTMGFNPPMPVRTVRRLLPQQQMIILPVDLNRKHTRLLLAGQRTTLAHTRRRRVNATA